MKTILTSIEASYGSAMTYGAITIVTIPEGTPPAFVVAGVG